MSITYLQVSPTCVDVLANRADDVFDADIQSEFARAFLADPRNILIVAIDGDLVVGQIVAILHRHLDAPLDLFIENLGVAPDWQRRGIARTLLAKAFKAGAELGAVSAWVLTEPNNHPAKALYEGLETGPEPTVMYSFKDLNATNSIRGSLF